MAKKATVTPSKSDRPPLWVWIVGGAVVVGAILAALGQGASPTPPAAATATTLVSPLAQPTSTTVVFPLVGLEFAADIFASEDLSGQALTDAQNFYRVRVESDGRYWQPNFDDDPNKPHPSYSSAVKLPAGRYLVNCVGCRLYLDENREGLGSGGKVVVDHQNGVEVEVRPKPKANEQDEEVAWGLFECDGVSNNGLEVRYLGPLLP